MESSISVAQQVATHAGPRVARSGVRLRGPLLTMFVAVLTIYILEYSTYLVRSHAADKIIKSLALLILIVAFPYQRLPRRFIIVLALYAALFFFTGLPAVVRLDANGLLQLLKVVLQFATLPLILCRFVHDLPPPLRLLRLPIVWAVVFALQGVSLFFLVVARHEPTPTTVMVGRLDNMTEKDFGIFGYGNTYGWNAAGGKPYIRPQGWFLEPTNLAAFMIYPAFMSWGLYRTKRRLWYLFAAAVCLMGVAFAFSLTGYMSLGAAAMALLMVRPRRREQGGPSPVRRLIGPILIAIGFLLFANYLMSRMYAISDSRSGTLIYYLLGRSRDSQKLVQDYWGLDPALALIRQNPFGIGLGHTLGLNEVDTSANAFIYWMVAAGVGGVLVVLLLYACLFYWFVIPCLSSRVPFIRMSAAAFAGTTVQGLQYGNWLNPWYLFTVAMMMLCGYYADRTARGFSAYPQR
ncbi:MAG TPA: hypothetical protein VLV78_15880 [Thermoanaerobaculia bacterium]|nr:hypothetical protein [Thermoanaerobaculia bacterium]